MSFPAGVPGESRESPGIRARFGPWLALVALLLSFELPTILAPDRIDLSALRPTGELLAALTIAASTRSARASRAIRVLLALGVLALAILRVDRTVFFLLSRSEPLLYDQLFMVRHLLVLLTDLWGYQVVLGLVALSLVTWLVIRFARFLLRRARALLEPERVRTTFAVGAAIWASVVALSLLPRNAKGTPWVRWMLPELAANLSLSTRIYRAVHRRIAESPYAAYSRIVLPEKPDVFLFFVESYGRLVAEHPGLRPLWQEELRGMEGRLTAAGFRSASGWVTAPVSGGRSWLAVGSILFGAEIRYEAELRQMEADVARAPTLVRFFAEHGYTTVHLAPSDRSRPGVKEENVYGYDRYVRFADLDYHGPKMGWGIVPDQYALGYTDEHVLEGTRRPLFFHFHMVSSHAPWETVPTFVEDYRELDRAGARPPNNLVKNEIGRRLARYTRADPRWNYLGDFTASYREGYERSILYDLHVIEEFLTRRTMNAVVVVMGDHQPPVVSPDDQSFDVPMHVIARDPKWLAEFEAAGFGAGLVPPGGPARLRHAALFSLFVRALARGSGSTTPLPELLPHGTGVGS